LIGKVGFKEDAMALEREDTVSRQVIAAGIEVHRLLGPGLLASAYEASLCREFYLMGIRFVRQKRLPITYKGIELACTYRLDVVVDDCVLLELKTVQQLERLHIAQVLAYLRLSKMRLGMLLNFNAVTMREGIRRVIN